MAILHRPAARPADVLSGALTTPKAPDTSGAFESPLVSTSRLDAARPQPQGGAAGGGQGGGARQ